jgi:hypothetical protein
MVSSVVEPETKAEEPKLNCLPEPKSQISAPPLAPVYLPHTWRNLIEKIMVAEEVFRKVLQF